MHGTQREMSIWKKKTERRIGNDTPSNKMKEKKPNTHKGLAVDEPRNCKDLHYKPNQTMNPQLTTVNSDVYSEIEIWWTTGICSFRVHAIFCFWHLCFKIYFSNPRVVCRSAWKSHRSERFARNEMHIRTERKNIKTDFHEYHNNYMQDWIAYRSQHISRIFI